MKGLKICVLTIASFASTGGAENLTYQLTQSLARKGYQVSVVCFPSIGILPEKEMAETPNINIYPILKPGKIGLIRNFLSLWSLLRRERFNIIHAHFAFPTGTMGLVGKLFRIPIVVTSHGVDIRKDKKIGYGMRLNKLAAIMIWFTLKVIDCLVVVSKAMVEDAIDAGCSSSKIRVIYNGIDLRMIPPPVSSDIFERNGITKNDFIILYLGRLLAVKCPQDVVQALPKILQLVPNARLVFAGQGEERSRLEDSVSGLNLKDKVIFTGFVTGDDKWSLLRRCDVFVLPAVVEAFGIAVIEAMACSKPVVATNLGPFPEIIRDGESGLLVPLHSPDKLANAIIQLALDEKGRAEMGEKARKEVEERFDINKTGDEYLKIYREVINRGKGG